MNEFSGCLLGKIKDALRITNSFMDSELIDIIDACKKDLELSGVSNITETDPLIIRAVVIYAKAHFSFSADNARFQQAYDALKTALCLSGDYNVNE